MSDHHWITPTEVATRVDATQHGAQWRAACPAHHGSNPTSLSIAEGRDKQGNPCTLLHCHAEQCSIDAICAALAIHVADLFVVHPDYTKIIQRAPRARIPELTALRNRLHPATQDEIALVMLADMIRSAPVFLDECEGARATFWRLAQAPAQQKILFQALRDAHIPIRECWARLQQEYGEQDV